MSITDRIAELADDVADYLTAGAVDGVLVTTDPLAIAPALPVGPVVAIQPPKVEFPTQFDRTYTWELFCIAGPAHDKRAALLALDPIITALESPLGVTMAEPATFDHPGIEPHAAYVLTFTETI